MSCVGAYMTRGVVMPEEWSRQRSGVHGRGVVMTEEWCTWQRSGHDRGVVYMAKEWSWQLSGHDSWVVMTVEWSWQRSGHDRGVVMTVEWSWQRSGHDSWVVMTVEWSWQRSGHDSWVVMTEEWCTWQRSGHDMHVEFSWPTTVQFITIWASTFLELSRFDDRYAEAIFSKCGLWDKVPGGNTNILKTTKFPFNNIKPVRVTLNSPQQNEVYEISGFYAEMFSWPQFSWPIVSSVLYRL